MTIQLSTKQAIAFYESKRWETMTDREIAEFQLTQDKLCVPFSRFHEAVGKALGRPVYTHEFGLNREGLIEELFGEGAPPAMQDIIDMLPADKTIVVQS